MKTHRFLASVAVASVLASASPAYAQVLGGGGLSGAVNGAMNGTLSGGPNGIGGMATGTGSVTGSIDGQTHAIDRVGHRAKGTADAAAAPAEFAVDVHHDVVGTADALHFPEEALDGVRAVLELAIVRRGLIDVRVEEAAA